VAVTCFVTRAGFGRRGISRTLARAAGYALNVHVEKPGPAPLTT